MFRINRLGGALLAACTIVLAIPSIAIAQDRDSQEVSSYVLSDAGLAKYTQATKNIAALPASSRSHCDDDDSDSQSIDQVVAKFNSAPGMKAAIQSAGMTTREYVVFSFSVFQNGMAAWALTQPGGKLPPGVSMANVNFYNKHAASLKSLDGLSENSDCEDDRDDDE